MCNNLKTEVRKWYNNNRQYRSLVNNPTLYYNWLHNIQLKMTSLSGCSAIDNLIKSSTINDSGVLLAKWWHLRWLPCSNFTNIGPIQCSNNQPIYYRTATYKQQYEDETSTMLLVIGTEDKCTQDFVEEFLEYTHFRYTNIKIHPTLHIFEDTQRGYGSEIR